MYETIIPILIFIRAAHVLSRGDLCESQQMKQSITSAYGVKWFLLGGRWVTKPPMAHCACSSNQFQADLHIYLRKNSWLALKK